MSLRAASMQSRSECLTSQDKHSILLEMRLGGVAEQGRTMLCGNTGQRYSYESKKLHKGDRCRAGRGRYCAILWIYQSKSKTEHHLHYCRRYETAHVQLSSGGKRGQSDSQYRPSGCRRHTDDGPTRCLARMHTQPIQLPDRTVCKPGQERQIPRDDSTECPECNNVEHAYPAN